MLSNTTEELSTKPQSSLRRILSFIGATPVCTGLLEEGQLPLLNPAGSKGRKKVAAPNWSDGLKQKTTDLITPTANASWPVQADPAPPGAEIETILRSSVLIQPLSQRLLGLGRGACDFQDATTGLRLLQSIQAELCHKAARNAVALLLIGVGHKHSVRGAAAVVFTQASRPDHCPIETTALQAALTQPLPNQDQAEQIEGMQPTTSAWSNASAESSSRRRTSRRPSCWAYARAEGSTDAGRTMARTD